MSRWPRHKLEDVAIVLAGFAWRSEFFSDSPSSGPPIIRIQNLGQNENAKLVYYSGPIVSGYWVEPNEILISLSGSFKVCRWSGPRALLNQRIVVVRPQSSMRQEFLFYQLLSRVQEIEKAAQGVAVSNTSMGIVREMEVDAPSLLEQDRIVRILDEADQLRRLRAEANRRTADLIPATFHEMFGNPPKTWPVAKFGDLGTLDRGRSKHRPRDEANLFGGPYPFIQTGDIANSGGCVEAYTQTYSELGLSQSKLWPERTLCITIAANIAKCAVLSFPACFPDSVVGFIPNELILVEFAQSWLETLQAKLEDEAPQAAQKNINLQTLRNLELRVPPVELQRTFAVRVSEIREMGAEQAASRRRLDDLFQSLLHRAFQGEL